jgi:redox-sensitive bicupin YhaK (pirin superfamily)
VGPAQPETPSLRLASINTRRGDLIIMGAQEEDGQVREVENVVGAHRQREGGGFIVRRPLPSLGLSLADPFLLIDEMGPAEYGPGQAVGAPDHPHRGFETVTYMLEGEFEHEDSAGHRGALRAGDVQWMTAGAGIIHSEMPSRRIREEGGRVHGFQIWVNLPARLKLTRPRYQEVPGARIPAAATPDGRARVRVIAGEALGVHAVIDTNTPIVYQDWSVDPGADVTVSVPPDHRALVYVFGGDVRVGDQGTTIADGKLALLGAGAAVRLRGGSQPARLLLLAGVPLGEPVARYGPFVMNTEEEIRQAARDYQSGRMGEITRTANLS